MRRIGCVAKRRSRHWRRGRRAASGWLASAGSAATIAPGSIGLTIWLGAHRAPLIATNDVLYHEPGRRVLQDVVTCIREHITIEDAGRRLEPNAERHIKPPEEMARLFREHPNAIAETERFAAGSVFRSISSNTTIPTEAWGNGEEPQETLERLTWEGADKRYPRTIFQTKSRQTIWSELCLIAYKGYAPYFLTVRDIVHFARHDRKILCQGRGSAANSAVCFCSGVTEVNPKGDHLVFGRFLSTERDEPPDIDVDFEHERREEVMQYVYDKYGGNHTGLTANVICYRSRAALREVAKVFGLSDDTIAAINQLHWGWGSTATAEEMRQVGLDPDETTLGMVLECAKELHGFPAPSEPACRWLRHYPRRTRSAGADQQVGDGDPRNHRMEQGRYRRAWHPQGRCAGARHAELPAPGFRHDACPLRRRTA